MAIVGRDVEFEELDINPCPVSIGNPRPNIFAGTARCRNTTVVSITLYPSVPEVDCSIVELGMSIVAKNWS